MRDINNSVMRQEWFIRGIGIFCAGFMIWFISAQWGGLVNFADYLAGTVSALPGSLEKIIKYYREVPGSVALTSMLVGILSGLVLTSGVYAYKLRVTDFPMFSGLAIFIGVCVGVVVYLLGLFLLASIAFAISTTFAAALMIQPQMRSTVAQNLSTAQLRRMLARSLPGTLLAGVGGGLLGSQMFSYTTQHCTFVDDASPAEKQIGIIVTIIMTAVVLIPVWTILNQPRDRRVSFTAGYFKGLRTPVLFLLPTILSLIVFLYYPASRIVTTSLNSSNARIPGRQLFVCLGNYTQLAEDITYRNSLVATAIITFVIVAGGMSIALAIAVLASQKVKGAYIYRTLLIWPYALSPVVAGVIFYTMFQQESGLINYILDTLFGVRPRWFTDVSLARMMVIFASVWNILGFNILFYIAGLQNIPEDLLEAAEIDGATRVQRFFRVTLPLLSPFTFFLLVTNVTYSFYGIYGVVDTLTSGGPRFGDGGASGATEVLIFRLYEGSSQAGSAAAQALVLFVMIAAITVFQFGYLERRITYAD